MSYSGGYGILIVFMLASFSSTLGCHAGLEGLLSPPNSRQTNSSSQNVTTKPIINDINATTPQNWPTTQTPTQTSSAMELNPPNTTQPSATTDHEMPQFPIFKILDSCGEMVECGDGDGADVCVEIDFNNFDNITEKDCALLTYDVPHGRSDQILSGYLSINYDSVTLIGDWRDQEEKPFSKYHITVLLQKFITNNRFNVYNGVTSLVIFGDINCGTFDDYSDYPVEGKKFFII